MYKVERIKRYTNHFKGLIFENLSWVPGTAGGWQEENGGNGKEEGSSIVVTKQLFKSPKL